MNGIERKRGVCRSRPVVQGTGIETKVLLDRFLAGDSCLVIGNDFNMSAGQVEDAVRFETCKACKCKTCAWARKIKVSK